MRKQIAWASILVCLMNGCANFVVRKVPVESLSPEKEAHLKGFRYYLSRPYVLVKKAIPVSTESQLFVVDKKLLGTAQVEPLPAQLEKAAAQGGLSRLDAKKEALETVTPDEWKRFRAQIEEKGAIVQTSGHGGTVSPQVNVEVRSNPTQTIDPSKIEVSSRDYVSGKETKKANKTGDSTVAADDLKLSGTKTVDLKGDIQVVFLPDFEEQYAVHNNNIIAKSDYKLRFKDGWQLQGVSGDFDSTTVALELLNTIDSAINAARNIARGSLGLSPAAAPSGREKASVLLKNTKEPVLEMVRTTYIKPGLYRINKPWEMGAGLKPQGTGLLAKMGLKMIHTVEWRKANPVKDPATP